MKKILCLLVMYSFISFAHTVDGDILVQGDTHDYSEAYTDDYADPYASEVNDQFGGLGDSALAAVAIGIIGIIMYGIGPIIVYIIGSYGLALIDRNYKKKERSGISWVPFARYYNIVKNATNSDQTAFYVTVLPWLVVIIGIIGVIVGGIITSQSGTDDLSIVSIVFGCVGILGMLSIIAMNFWRAFIISRYIKGDTTTALGLSTYTSIVLWYVGLDRFYHKTDIIGKIGFVLLALIGLLYLGVIVVVVYNGYSEGFGGL